MLGGALNDKINSMKCHNNVVLLKRLKEKKTNLTHRNCVSKLESFAKHNKVGIKHHLWNKISDLSVWSLKNMEYERAPQKNFAKAVIILFA